MNYRKALNLAYGVSADNKSAVGDWAKSLTGYKDWDSPWCEAKQSIQRGGQQYIRPLREIREEMDEASKVQFDSHVAKKVKEIKETYEEINIADIAMDIRKTYGFSELPDGAIGLAAMHPENLSPTSVHDKDNMDLCIISVSGEILEIVFSFLCQTDIKATRQVCKIFHDSSSRYLLHEVIVGSQTKTLDRADEISKHRLFCNHITTVVYATCSLRRDYATLDDYYEDLVQCAQDNHYSVDTIPGRIQCVPHWQSYRELYKDQARVQGTDTDKLRIQEILHRLPNIKHLELSSNAWKSSAHPLRSVWGARDKVIIGPSYDLVGRPCQLTHGFEVMSFALRANRILLDSLMQTGEGYLSLQKPCFSGLSQEIFYTLRRIRLCFTEESLAWQDEVASCLIAAQDLYHLDLKVTVFSDDEPVFRNIFLNTWSSLSYLALDGLDLDYDLFIAFCQRHQTCIRHLRLTEPCLFGGTWPQLVDEIRPLLQLTEAFLEDLAEASEPAHTWDLGGRQAGYYLLHGGENPFINGVLRLVEGLEEDSD